MQSYICAHRQSSQAAGQQRMQYCKARQPTSDQQATHKIQIRQRPRQTKRTSYVTLSSGGSVASWSAPCMWEPNGTLSHVRYSMPATTDRTGILAIADAGAATWLCSAEWPGKRVGGEEPMRLHGPSSSAPCGPFVSATGPFISAPGPFVSALGPLTDPRGPIVSACRAVTSLCVSSKCRHTMRV